MENDLVGVAEVAAICGLAAATVRSHLQRGTIVAPIEVAGSNALVWRRGDVVRWNEARRRRPRGPHPLWPRWTVADATGRASCGHWVHEGDGFAVDHDGTSSCEECVA